MRGRTEETSLVTEVHMQVMNERPGVAFRASRQTSRVTYPDTCSAKNRRYQILFPHYHITRCQTDLCQKRFPKYTVYEQIWLNILLVMLIFSLLGALMNVRDLPVYILVVGVFYRFSHRFMKSTVECRFQIAKKGGIVRQK